MGEVADFDSYVMSGVRSIFERENNEWFSLLGIGQVAALNLTEVDIQPQMGATVLPTSAGTLSLVSDDANDTFGGTGCQAVLVIALDGDYLNGGQDISLPYHLAVVLTAGLTPVTVPLPMMRQVGMQNIISGTLGTSAGTITSDIAGADQMLLRPGDGTARSLRQVVPGNWQGYSSRTIVFWSADNDANVVIQTMSPDGTLNASLEAEVNAGRSQIDAIAFALQPRTDVIFRASRVSGGGTDNIGALNTLVLRRTPG